MALRFAKPFSFQIENGKIQKEYNNYNTRKIHANKDLEVKCENCIHGFKEKIECKRNSVSNLPDFLKFYLLHFELLVLLLLLLYMF